MEQKMTDEQLLEFIESGITPEFEKMLEVDSDLKRRFDELKEVVSLMENSKEVAVPSHIKAGFEVAMAQELSKTTGRSWMQVAAAVAILVIGFGLGKWSGTDNSMELAELKTEIRSLQNATLTNTLQQHSASERILAVNKIEETQTINEDLLFALIGTLNSDESPNVRYAALQALKNFINDENVRAEMVKSLESQTDPLIQISLITILVEAEERGAIVPLKELMDSDQTTPEVKQQAEIAIKVLT